MEDNTTVAVEESAAVDSMAAEAALPQKKKRKPINQQKLQDNLWGWAFCVPLIVGTVLFIYIALVMALLLSFTTYNSLILGPGDSIWTFLGDMFAGKDVYSDSVGNTDPLRWYKYVFQWEEYSTGTTTSPYPMNVTGMLLFNTVFYAIGIPIGMVLAMFFAVCMSRDIKGGNVFRVVYYLPCVASTVSIVYTFTNMFGTDGVINRLLGANIPWFREEVSQPWLTLTDGGDPFWGHGLLQKSLIIIMAVWKGLGGTIILYIAGLSGVNASTKEAAQIDGANGWRIFWKITMPDLYPVIFYNIVTAVIGGMQIYAEPELFFPTASTTGSYPNFLTSGYVSLIWFWGVTSRARIDTNYYDPGIPGNAAYQSLGAAYGMVLAVIILVLTLFQFWLDRKNND